MKLQPKTDKYGFICVDKPSGITSTAVVNTVKRLTGLPCGHMGTLDPLASGVLPVAVGNASRLFDYFLKKEKRYIAEFTFGQTSDTLDSTGEVVKEGRIPTHEEIEKAIPSLLGKQLQIPPKYSAKSVDGKRGYLLAREGVDFELAPKEVEIKSILFLGGEEDRCRFEIVCSAGTYVRSIARDLGEKLGTKALMSGLVRTKSGCFELAKAIPFADLNENNFEKAIVPTEAVLDLPILYFSETDRIFCGNPAFVDTGDGLYKIYRGKEFYGLAEVCRKQARTKTKLC